MPTAGAVIIGDELLSGKVADSNSARLIAVLRQVGVELKRIIFVGDDTADIGAAVRECAERYDHVFTSGGVGPTHDDRTIEAIAREYGCEVVREPQLTRLLEQFLGDRLNEAALKMAEVPAGSRLLGAGPYPTITFRNIFILPGVPSIFAAKLELIRTRFHGRAPVVHRIYLRGPESEIAEALAQVDRELPEVRIGSYPTLTEQDHHVMVSVEAEAAAQVEDAVGRLLERLPRDRVVRVDDGSGG